MAKIDLPYGAWRDGRPRFVPGPRERALGFTGKDLQHADGRWYDLAEAHGWLSARRDDIRQQRKSGRKLKSPPVARGRAAQDLWHAFINSNEFVGSAKLGIKGLAPATRSTYKKWIKPLTAEPVWIAPVASLDPTILKSCFETVMAARGKANAKGMMAALQSALSWGRLRGWFPKVNGQPMQNPASRLDLPGSEVRLRVARDFEIAALLAASDLMVHNGAKLSAVGDAILTGLFSGQRKKDVLAFIPGEMSNSRIDLIQSKTGARVSIPMAPRLVERIEAGRARRSRAGYRVTAANIVINEGTGLPYHGTTFAQHFQMVRDAAIAGVPGLLDPCPSLAAPGPYGFTFPDLRDTAVTWYARAGCTVPEIASITGHTLVSIYSILKHYLALDAELADNAVRKLVDYMEREGLAV